MFADTTSMHSHTEPQMTITRVQAALERRDDLILQQFETKEAA